MNARNRAISYPSTSASPSTPPGVKIDKRTSLRLTSNKGFAEEDVDSLVSGLSVSSSAADNSGSGGKKKARLLRKLQWRPHPASNSKGKRLPPSTSPLSQKLGAPSPRRTKSGGGKKYGINTIGNDSMDKDLIRHSSSCDATVASLKTSYTRGSQVTTVSSQTLKHSNRGMGGAARAGGGNGNRFNSGASVSSSSVKSSLPPLARLRNKRVPSLVKDSFGTEAKHHADDEDEATSCYSENSITLSAQNISPIATAGDSITISTDVPSESIDNNNNTSSSQQIACSYSDKYCPRNTCTPSKYCAGNSENVDSPTSVVLAQDDVFYGELTSLENVDDLETGAAAGNTDNTNSTTTANRKPPSFNKRGVTLSTTKSGKTMETYNDTSMESELTDTNNTGEYRNAMDRTRKLMIGDAETDEAEQDNAKNGEKLTDTSMETSIFADLISASNNPEENSNNEDFDDASTVQNNRHSGPIDVDTLTRHVTPTERRHLRAMHKLGYYHLRQNEINQALNVFMEILRGQRERHGSRSLEVAMAMHNLGVVCVKGERFEEGARLCDGAVRIRVDKLGKDHLDVAVSLAQQGVALMEMQEYATALASFCEALRIRRKALGSKHPLVIRLLNNIGCALFELNNLVESKIAFEEALALQRDLMRENSLGGNSSSSNDVLTGIFDANDDQKDLGLEEKNLEVDPKGAHNMLLSIALTLCNLGSIHLRWGKYDESLVFYEEALLIQESVLGEENTVVMNTNESIDFVIRSKEENRQDLLENHGATSNIDRLANLLRPRYEEGKKIYDKVSNEMSALIDSLASPSSIGDFMEGGSTPFPCSAGGALDQGHIVKQLMCGQPLMCVDEQSLNT